MTFSDDTLAALQKPLDPARVKSREGPRGRALSYVEGYDIIRAANDIFGFGGWSFEIQSMQALDKGIVATVRLTVGDVVREDVGWGDGDPEKAHKEAVTDALKRAFRTFGDQFGLDLYDKESDLHAGNGNRAGVAQRPEQRSPEPRAGGSNPPARANTNGTSPPHVCKVHNVVMVKGRTGKYGHMITPEQACFGEPVKVEV